MNGVDPTGEKTYSFDAVINVLWTFGSVSISGYSDTYYRVELTYTDANGKQQKRGTVVSSRTRITAAERDRLLALIPKKKKSTVTRTKDDVALDSAALSIPAGVTLLVVGKYLAIAGASTLLSDLVAVGGGVAGAYATTRFIPIMPEGTYTVLSENDVYYDKQRDQIYFKETVSWIRHGDTNFEHSYSKELWFDLYY